MLFSGQQAHREELKVRLLANKKTDAISGATPPWGAPDQGWGKGSRPAITMSWHAANVYCQWFSKVTGKNTGFLLKLNGNMPAGEELKLHISLKEILKILHLTGFLKKDIWTGYSKYCLKGCL